MKKWMSLLLTLAMLLTICVGCGGQNTPPANNDGGNTADTQTDPTAPDSGIFYDLTGIQRDEILVTVNDLQVPSDLYFYWLAYVCASIENSILTAYESGYYREIVDSNTGAINWDGLFQGDMTAAEFAKSEVETTLRHYLAIEEMALEYGVPLNIDDTGAIELNIQYGIEEMGGEDAFNNYLSILGITQDTFRDLTSYSYLFDNLLNLVYTEGSKIYLPIEEYNNYAVYADHILFSSVDMSSGDYLATDVFAKKAIRAQEVAEELKGIADAEERIARFNELADELSDDPSRSDYPDGYVYTPGSMVEEFEKMASTLKPGEVSEPTLSDYGYHVILRKDLLEKIESDPEQKRYVASDYLDDLIRERSADMVCTYDQRVEKLNVGAFYNAYIQEAERINALYANKDHGSLFYD